MVAIVLVRAFPHLHALGPPFHDQRQTGPDIGLARGALGWTPQVGLSAGLAMTIDYFRRRLSAASAVADRVGG